MDCITNDDLIKALDLLRVKVKNNEFTDLKTHLHKQLLYWINDSCTNNDDISDRESLDELKKYLVRGWWLTQHIEIDGSESNKICPLCYTMINKNDV